MKVTRIEKGILYHARRGRRSQREFFGNPLSRKGHYNRHDVRRAILAAYDRKVWEWILNGGEKARGNEEIFNSLRRKTNLRRDNNGFKN